MIPRPSPAQLLQQCRLELRETIMPRVSDETMLVALDQIQMIIDACAHRCEHDIADTVAETAEMETFVDEAIAHHGDRMPRTASARDDLASGRTSGLLASEVSATHDLASEALSCAIEELMDLEDQARVDALVAWMAGPRQVREAAASVNWSMPGRG